MIKMTEFYKYPDFDEYFEKDAVIVLKDDFENEIIAQTTSFYEKFKNIKKFELWLGTIYKNKYEEEYIYIEKRNKNNEYSLFRENVNAYSGKLQIKKDVRYIKIGEFKFEIIGEIPGDIKDGDYIEGSHAEIFVYID